MSKLSTRKHAIGRSLTARGSGTSSRYRSVERLIEIAVEAQNRAYCPYSRYPVGAAVLTETGRVFFGCNVENASYGLSMCAERAAIYHAVAGGHDALKAVCVVGTAAKPCGACRQVMFEFSDKDTGLYLVDFNSTTGRRSIYKTTVYKLLPLAFDLPGGKSRRKQQWTRPSKPSPIG